MRTPLPGQEKKRRWLNETKNKLPKWFWEASKKRAILERRRASDRKRERIVSSITCLNKDEENNVKCYLSCLKSKSENKTGLTLDAQWWFISFPVRCLARTPEHWLVVLVVPLVYKIRLTLLSLENLENKPSKRYSHGLRKLFPSRKCRSQTSLRSQCIQNNYWGKHVMQTHLRQLWNETAPTYQFQPGLSQWHWLCLSTYKWVLGCHIYKEINQVSRKKNGRTSSSFRG